MKVYNKLEQIRTEKGMTQGQLADAVGVSRTMVSYFERGLRSPSVPILLRIAKALDTTPNDLLGIDNN